MRQIERRAKVYAGTERPPVPESFVFYGFTTPGLTDDQVMRAIERLEKYGLPPYAGGQLDQPAQFWHDVDMYQGIYNFGLNEAYKEIERRNARRSETANPKA